MRAKLLFPVLFGATLILAFPGAASAASFTVLHNFGGPEGETPAAPLVQGVDGSFYGVAAHGGDFTVLPPDGAGTVFRMDANGSVQTLHTFRGPEGAWPKSLIQARDGFFYGTATFGGQPGITNLNPGTGTIFRMDTSGAVTLLYVFPYAIGGGSSQPGPIVQGKDGALYGTALGAFGTNAIGGYVYRFDPITGDLRHLHDFTGSDGAIPTGPLFQAGDGFFYGTTNQGGPWNSGVIYKVDAFGRFTLLHSLSPLFPGEGSEPKGGVVQASDGFFYGTTEKGGYGGEIFRMDAAGNFTVLHRFDAYFSDGGFPKSGLIEGRDGFLYGTAAKGGQPVNASRYGVVYRMDKSGAVTVMHTFTGPDGYEPWAALVQGTDGGLYGSTVVGGTAGLGVLFRVDTAAPPVVASLSSVTLNPTQVTGGLSSTGTVTLTGPAPAAGAVVSLGSNNGKAVVPVTVIVSAGSSSATFPVTTTSVITTTTATITGNYGGQTRSATLTILPPASVKLASLTLNPTVVHGGWRSVGTVRLTAAAPAGGAVVKLGSSAPSVAFVPASVTVPAGVSSATFYVRTSTVGSTRSVTISAAYGGVTKGAVLTVTP
jgi:uncharacterized repeat protein (TIGR03803 family)